MRPAVAATVVALAAIAVSGALAAACRDQRRVRARDCSVAESRRLVVDFVRPFDRGNATRLDRIFAPAGSFRWYSTDGSGRRLGAEAYDRSTLIRYFEARHTRGERPRLRWWRGRRRS